jgi:uncharacterized damage-inducible protein DinB
MMNMFRLCGIAALLVPGMLAAQQPGTAGSNPTTEAAKQLGARFSRMIVSAAEEVPAEKLAYKPTEAQMTFGEVWAHLAGANRSICRAIGGMSAPAATERKGSEAKDALVNDRKESFAFCDRALAATDDTKLGEQVDLGFMIGTRALAMFIYIEDLADHYSQVANYMRLNGMLPPSAKKREGSK